MRFEKGENKIRQKVGSNSGRSCQNARTLPSTPLKLMLNERDWDSVDYPNHTLVGGVSVNSLCQQGGLFALSVNRHAVKKNLESVGRFWFLDLYFNKEVQV